MTVWLVFKARAVSGSELRLKATHDLISLAVQEAAQGHKENSDERQIAKSLHLNKKKESV